MDLYTMKYEDALVQELRGDIAAGATVRTLAPKLKGARHHGFDEAQDGSLLVVYLWFWTLVCGDAGLKALPTKLTR